MAKKKNLNPAVMYFNQVGFERLRGKFSVQEALFKALGEKDGNEALWELSNLDYEDQDFVEYIVSDPRIEDVVVRSLYLDYVRKVCDYITGHRDYVGETILEVGCEGGYFTGFLALNFPESKIVAIDICPEAIRIAEARMEKLGVKNVEFRCMPLAEVTEKFDTVFSTRMLWAIVEWNDTFIGEVLEFQKKGVALATLDYRKQLVNACKEEGYIFMSEEYYTDLNFCSLFVASQEPALGYLPETYETFTWEMPASVEAEPSRMLCLIAQPGRVNTEEEIDQVWDHEYRWEIRNGKKVLDGMAGIYFLSKHAGELLMGCDALDDKGEPVCRCGFWTIKDDENHICYLYTMREEDGQAAYLEIQKNDITMEQIKNSLDVTMELNYGGKGMTIRYIDPEKDCVEGRGNESDQGHEE